MRVLLQMTHSLVAHLVLRANIDELAQVFREEKVESPVESHAHLLLQTRQFAQIDGAPHPPGQKARDIHAENAGDPGAMSDGCKLSNGLEIELPELAAVHVSLDILRHDLALPKSMLRRRRA